MMKFYCEVCSNRYTAQRSTSKYCSNACRQKAKYRRTHDFPESDLSELDDNVEIALYNLEKFINDDKKSDEHKLTILASIENYQFVLNKIQAILGTLEMRLDEYWYECLNCGQKAFGRTEKCDFCNQSDFKLITPKN